MFGFLIYGCIDGLSRKLVWLFVSTTNNLLVVANFFLKAIPNLGRAPNIFRMDLGTENAHCEELLVFSTKNSKQPFVRCNQEPINTSILVSA